jgi:hypothetical protein
MQHLNTNCIPRKEVKENTFAVFRPSLELKRKMVSVDWVLHKNIGMI